MCLRRMRGSTYFTIVKYVFMGATLYIEFMMIDE